MGPHTKTLVNKIEIVQIRAARFCHNDYKTIEKGCVSEMIRKLNLEPLNIRRTNKRLTIFHKAINGHLALPIGHLQPVLRRTGHLNSKAYNTIHTSKDCYKNSFFSTRTIKDWNSLPDKIATIKDLGSLRYGTLTIRYVSRYLSHDTIRIAILGENRKMNQLITIGSLYCILCSFDLSRQHLAFALLLLFNSMNTLYIIV